MKSWAEISMLDKGIFAVLCLGLSGVAYAAIGDKIYLTGRSYDQDGIKWSDRLARREPYAAMCTQVGEACFIDALMVRNEGNRDLRCQISVVYPQPSRTGVANVKSVEIIAAGEEREVVQTLRVPSSLQPVSFESKCDVLPELAPLTTPAECTAIFVRTPDLDSYFPPGSKMRGEQGSVVVEFTLAQSPGPPSDVTVARSSEHPDLDAAARRFIERTRLETHCPGQRFRKTVSFRYQD